MEHWASPQGDEKQCCPHRDLAAPSSSPVGPPLIVSICWGRPPPPLAWAQKETGLTLPTPSSLGRLPPMSFSINLFTALLSHRGLGPGPRAHSFPTHLSHLTQSQLCRTQVLHITSTVNLFLILFSPPGSPDTVPSGSPAPPSS